MDRRENHPAGRRGAWAARQHRRGLIALLLAGLAGWGCGYRFHAGEGRLPDGGRRLRIPVAQNRTPEGQVGALWTEALRREAARSGLEVVEAEAPTLIGVVRSVNAVPRGVAVSGGRFVTREQEAVVVVELRMRLPGGVWKVTLSDRESYLSATDLRGTEANRSLAIRRIMERLAREGIDRLSRGF